MTSNRDQSANVFSRTLAQGPGKLNRKLMGKARWILQGFLEKAFAMPLLSSFPNRPT
jgi:hypothetical protein